ncbi:MAG: hypothetical protein ACFHWX_13875 [Bacteroidota bacterium]
MSSCGPAKPVSESNQDTSTRDKVTSVSLSEPSNLSISVCSFNIKFVGLYKKKDHTALADLLKAYDLVLIQELVSPPVDGVFPDGSAYSADPEARAFVDAMTNNGFKYVLSDEDTGTNEEIHSNSSSTEWFIAFYDTTHLSVDDELFNEFLAADRSNHPSYERVPFAFSFKTKDRGLDFTLISVHLNPGSGTSDKNRRKEELTTITQWINNHNSVEKDFLIVGDMNIYSQEELMSVLPAGYKSLNEACIPTNIASSGKPYDHVMYNPTYSGTEVDSTFEILDLIEMMRPYWTDSTTPYPGNDLNLFYQYYSDHKPVVFNMVSYGTDDD